MCVVIVVTYSFNVLKCFTHINAKLVGGTSLMYMHVIPQPDVIYVYERL